MLGNLKLISAGVSDIAIKRWQEGGVYKINRIHMPLEGKVFYRNLNHELLLDEGYVYLLTNSNSRNFKVISGHKYYHLFFDFQAFPPLAPNDIEINLSKDLVLFYLLRATQNLIGSNGETSNKYPMEYNELSQLLGVIITHIGNNYNLSFVKNKTIEQAIRFIEENYKEQISIDDVANAIHVDKRNLLRIFAKHMAMSPYQYLRQFRIENAIICLNEGKSVSEAAFLCGYKSENSFGVSFKKVTGYSPTAMIKKHPK